VWKVGEGGGGGSEEKGERGGGGGGDGGVIPFPRGSSQGKENTDEGKSACNRKEGELLHGEGIVKIAQ